MSITKERRIELEQSFQRNNDNPYAICTGWFYNQRKGKEVCPCRDLCEKYKKHQKAKENLDTYFDLPQVKFYYVNAFRKCKFRTNTSKRKSECKFTLMVGKEQFELKAFQSPRGIRVEDRKPNFIVIDCYQECTQTELFRLIGYLQTLAYLMETTVNDIQY